MPKESIAMMFGGALIFVGLLIAVAYALGWRPNDLKLGSQGPREEPKSPLDILKERYARGEIAREEYLEMLEHLRE
jgi:putative membrane protein